MKSTAANLKYEVIYVSSEDEQNPASALSEAAGRGWQSARFCSFPQTLVIQFAHVVELQQIQFLSHQSKIASKIEIYTFVPPADGPSAYSLSDLKFKRLGYLSLDSNERSDYQARQLKSVYVSAPSYCLKLVLHQCHTNRYNLHNQVGLIALSCYGTPFGGTPSTSTKPSTASASLSNLDSYESSIREKIKQIITQKDAAVARQDFDEAKNYKTALDQLLSVAPHLTELDHRKRLAIQQEDYDSAKIIKQEIERIRTVTFQQLPGATPAVPPAYSQPRANLFEEVKGTPSVGPSPQAFNPNPPSRGGGGVPFSYEEQKGVGGEVERPPPSRQSAKVAPSKKAPNPDNPFGNNQNNRHGEEQVIPALRNKDGPFIPPGQQFDANPSVPPPALPEDLAGDAEPLTGQQMKKAEPYLGLFGEDTMSKILSKNWSLREQGLKDIESQILRQRSASSSAKTALLSGILGVASLVMQDRIAQVVQKALHVLNTALQKLSGSELSSDGHSSLENVLGGVIQRLGDNNPRVREAAESVAFQMACHSAIGPTPVAYKAIQGTKKKTGGNFARLLKGRLSLLDLLVRDFPLNSKHGGVPPEKSIEFTVEGFKHSSQDVRNMAFSLMMELFKKLGRAKLQPFLEELRPAQLETLEEGFQQASGKRKSKGSGLSKKESQSKVEIITHISPTGASPKPKRSSPEPTKSPSKKKPAPSAYTSPPEEDLSEEEEGGDIAEEQPEMQSVSNKVCNFCHKFSEDFNQDKLDLHYWKECAMLSGCQYCGQIVEIANLVDHRLNHECELEFRQCPRCQMAIPEAEFDDHIRTKLCHQSRPGATVCPLCSQEIKPPNVDGWRRHLLVQTCPNNPRHPSVD